MISPALPGGHLLPDRASEVPMNDKKILKSIKALARGECANYQNGFCRETDERCHVINPNYDSVHDGAIDCDYFLESVLPADWELNDLVAYALWYDEEEPDELPEGMKLCPVCKRPFTASNNRQTYCPDCGKDRQRQMDRERKQKERKK